MRNEPCVRCVYKLKITIGAEKRRESDREKDMKETTEQNERMKKKERNEIKWKDRRENIQKLII